TSVLTGIALAAYQTAYFGAVQDAGLALGTLITLGASPILVSAGAHVLEGRPARVADRGGRRRSGRGACPPGMGREHRLDLLLGMSARGRGAPQALADYRQKV
ncbi:hypothetical protein ACIA8I_41115, partial [Streptomyces rishiriensis]